MKTTKQVSEYLKEYSYRVEWSEDDGVFIAKAIEFPSILAHGNSPEDAIKAVKSALSIVISKGKVRRPLW